MKVLARVSVAAIVLTACDFLAPGEVCGCPPLGGGNVVIAGVVKNAADSSAPGSVVTLQALLDAPCHKAAPGFEMVAAVPAGPDGRFRHTDGWGSGSKCFRLFARPAADPSGAASDTQVVNVEFRIEGAVPDSVEVLLRLK